MEPPGIPEQDSRLVNVPLSLGCCFYSLMMDLQGNKDIRVSSSVLGDWAQLSSAFGNHVLFIEFCLRRNSDFRSSATAALSCIKTSPAFLLSLIMAGLSPFVLDVSAVPQSFGQSWEMPGQSTAGLEPWAWCTMSCAFSKSSRTSGFPLLGAVWATDGKATMLCVPMSNSDFITDSTLDQPKSC